MRKVINATLGQKYTFYPKVHKFKITFYPEIHMFKITFLSHFSQNSHFPQNSHFSQDSHFSQNSYFQKSHFSQNSQFFKHQILANFSIKSWFLPQCVRQRISLKKTYLWHQRSVSVLMLDHSRCWQGHIGDRHNHGGSTLIMFPITIGHIIDPLTIVLFDESFVLTRIPIVTSWKISVSAVESSDYPPIPFDLRQKTRLDKLKQV